MRQEEQSQSSTSLKWLIEEGAREGKWDRVRSRCETHPDEIQEMDSQSGRTVLHQLCATPESPEDVFKIVAENFPEATKMQENKYMATPLHILAWSTLKSVGKVQILLDHMDSESILLKNRFGGTVLHSACGMNAWLPVIKLIVEKNPAILLERTHDYNDSALTALWHSHLQSIPGHMAIARILEGDEVNEEHFERFWEKVEYLVCGTFKLSPMCPPDIDPTTTDYLLFGLIHLRAPINTMKVALKRNPAWAAHADVEGNYPLHHVVIRRPFRIKDIELISELVKAYPQAAGKRNNEGCTPLFLAIHGKMVWEEGLGEIVKADTDVLASRDKETGLYPFLLAASEGGRVAVNTTYQLLCAKPHLVKDALKTNFEIP